MAKAKTTAAKPKTRKRNQGQVPGTERPEIEHLTDAAEAYRKTVAQRMVLQREESDQKAHLLSTVHRCFREKDLEAPPTDKSTPTIVYKYEDDDGIERDVKFQFGAETVKVNKAEGEK